jgi:predicted RNase H-like nuclease (RuvC/YqgF family)
LERDVNWNDPVILCEECAVKVGSLIGMLTPDDKKDMDRTVEKLKKEIHKLKAEMDAVKRRANKAIRRARATEVLS